MPIFFFHGFPGSRYDGETAGQAAVEMGIRLIAPDRPGMGYSDFQPKRRLLDWPDDICVLADALELGNFGILGYSGEVLMPWLALIRSPAAYRGGSAGWNWPGDRSGGLEGMTE